MSRESEPITSLATYEKDFVTVKGLAEYYDISERTVRRMIEAGALAGIRVGRQWRIPIEAARKAFRVTAHGDGCP